MSVRRAYRCALAPNVRQRVLRAKHANTWSLARGIALSQQTGKTTNAGEQHRERNRRQKTAYPWRSGVSTGAPRRRCGTWTGPFRASAGGCRKVGFPRFGEKGWDDRFRLMGAVRVVGRAVQLPLLGAIRLKAKPQVRGRILSATVSREADRWAVSLTVKVDLPELEPVRGPAVGD